MSVKKSNYSRKGKPGLLVEGGVECDEKSFKVYKAVLNECSPKELQDELFSKLNKNLPNILSCCDNQ